MAKIVAKSRPGNRASVKIEGRLDDAAVLTVDVIMQLGAQIRATLLAGGVKHIEPEGEEPNDFALAMVHMTRAVQQRERETVDQGRGQPALRLVGQGAGETANAAAGADGVQCPGEDTPAQPARPEGGGEPPQGEDQ